MFCELNKTFEERPLFIPIQNLFGPQSGAINRLEEAADPWKTLGLSISSNTKVVKP